jgi:hypothetical protein
MNAFWFDVGCVIVYLQMLRRCICSRPSRTEVGSSRLLGIVGQPMYPRYLRSDTADICDPTNMDILYSVIFQA